MASGLLGMDSSMMGYNGDMDRGELRRYMFATELNGSIGTKSDSKTNSTFTWKPEGNPFQKKDEAEGDDSDSLRHTLVIRRVILGPGAKEGESNWVTVEVSDPDGSDTKFPLAHLTKGKESQTMVDLAFPDAQGVSVKFILAEGIGPVHIVGYHLIERLQDENQEECEEEETCQDMDDEEAVDDEAKTVTKVNTIRAKRRINGDHANADSANAKKIKTANDEPTEGCAEVEN